MSNNIRNNFDMRKIKKFNDIDQKYNDENFVNYFIKSEKIVKPKINIKSLADEKECFNTEQVKESKLKMVNNPYKGIIKNFDYNKIIIIGYSGERFRIFPTYRGPVMFCELKLYTQILILIFV